MASVEFDRTSRAGIDVRRGRSDARTGARNALRFCAVALAAATLAACAQTGAFNDRTASRTASRHASPESSRTASFVRTRSAYVKRTKVAATKVATKEQTPSAASTKKPADSSGASYGLASYYGESSRTASGEKFNARELTAAHRTLPFGTRVRVTNVSTGKSVTVRVNDRGPFVAGRVIDVSPSAAESLGLVGRGVAKVKLDVVQ